MRWRFAAALLSVGIWAGIFASIGNIASAMAAGSTLWAWVSVGVLILCCSGIRGAR